MHRRPFLNIAAYTYLFVMLALLFMPLLVRAQALPSTGFPYVTTGNTHVFSGGVTSASNAASFTFANPANGAVYAQSTQSLPLGGGYTATVQARSAPTPATVARAARNLASKVIVPLTVGIAIYDFARELGYDFDNGGGSLVVRKSDPEVCSVAPCYQYRKTNSDPWLSTAAAACNTLIGIPYTNQGTIVSIASVTGGIGASCVVVTNTGGGGPFALKTQAVGASQPSYVSSSLTEFEAAVAAKSGWPSGSHIGRVMQDAVASGEPVALPAPHVVTGPVSVPGVPSVTNFPDGSKVTVTPEKSIGYGPGSVSVTDRSVTTQTSPSGVVTPVQDTVAPAPLPATAPPPEIEIETCGLPGKPACKIDEVGTPSAVPATQYDVALDGFKQSVDDNRAVIGGTGDKSFFGGWSLFFFAPPVVQCEPLAMPNYLGVQIDALDPCPVADGMRTVMGYIWALVALYLCLRMIHEAA